MNKPTATPTSRCSIVLKTEASATKPTTPKVELLTSALLEHEWMTPAERMSTAWEALLLLVVRVVTTIEACTKLWVDENLVCLVDLRHLLLGILLGDSLLGCLVWVVGLGQFAVGRLDLALVGILGDTENLVVVLCLGPSECDLSFPEEAFDQL